MKWEGERCLDLEKVREAAREEVRKAFAEESVKRTVHHELEEDMWQLMYERIDRLIEGVLREIIWKEKMIQKIIEAS